MRSIILIFTLILFFGKLANGQSMQLIIENLIKHQLIGEDQKKDVELILTHPSVSLKSQILEALKYAEMIKVIGKDNLNKDISSIKLELYKESQNVNSHQQDSINQDLSNYLNNLHTAGLISDSVKAEFKNKIQERNYPMKMLLIDEILTQTNYSHYFNPSTVSDHKIEYLTKKQIEDAILNWQKAGILNHLTDEQISTAKRKAVATNNENLNDVLLNFPHVVHWFDTELENLNDPYAELLRELSKITHGIFQPTNISDNFSKPVKNKVTVQFELNNNTYSKTLEIQDDWIDTAFFDFLYKIISENKLSGQFYELDEGGQGGILIFLTIKQYEYLKTNKLVVFAEQE